MKELKILLTATALGLVLATAIAQTRAYAESIHSEISNNVIRFHVLANSDSTADQNLKNLVRDGVLEKFEISPTTHIKDTRAFLTDNLSAIESHAAYIIQQNGYNYPVKAVIDTTFFPTRTYGHMAFPAGVYEAVRLIIGEGVGGNWWCVMFPPLCYVEATTPTPGLSDTLSEEAYALLNDGTVTVRFRVVEWWQEQMYSS